MTGCVIDKCVVDLAVLLTGCVVGSLTGFVFEAVLLTGCVVDLAVLFTVLTGSVVDRLLLTGSSGQPGQRDQQHVQLCRQRLWTTGGLRPALVH